ncbi:MAG: hypothetical protein Q4D96_13880 [Propionibacteriaceae bacterium]|nr:hypothetical protein [Propionibacteriaceae bacterium]
MKKSAALVLLFLAACTPPTASVEQAWAADFEEARQEIQSDFARGVLADSEVTDAELEETKTRFVSCMEQQGFPGVTIESGGAYDVPNNGQTEEQLDAASGRCQGETDFGTIARLHDEVRINPKNVKWTELVAPCLVRKGVVAEGYTPADYERDSKKIHEAATAGNDLPMEQVYPFIVDEEQAMELLIQCEMDPTS